MSGNLVHRYGGVAQGFHWLIAIMVFVMFGLGWYMTDLAPADPEKFRLYQIHKGIGIAILVLALLRLLWRITHPAPPLPETMKSWERLLASGAHWALYGLILLQPVIGILQSNAANFPIVLFGSFELPALIGQDKVIGEWLTWLHHLLAKGLALLILAHIGAALRHHIMLKDDVLRRMLPGAVVGTAAIVLALAFVGPFFLTSKSAGVIDAGMVTNTTAASDTEVVTNTDAAPAVSAVPDDQAATDTGELWTVLEGSMLGFVAKQQGSAVEGRFENFDARIVFDPDDPETSKLEVDIDATSISTGHNDRDQMLNSPSFFDTGKWPKAAFKSTEIVAKSERQFEARGQLTIRDVSKEATLPFTLDITADPGDASLELAHAQGALPILRLDYGVGQGDWASTGTVADEVVITIDIKASRAK